MIKLSLFFSRHPHVLCGLASAGQYLPPLIVDYCFEKLSRVSAYDVAVSPLLCGFVVSRWSRVD